MVDTREVFAGMDTFADLALWKRRLDEQRPELHPSADEACFAASPPSSSTLTSSSSSSAATNASADVSSTGEGRSGGGSKRQRGTRADDDEDNVALGPYYDEGADLKDELWVSRKYLSHQPAVAQQLEHHRQQQRRQQLQQRQEQEQEQQRLRKLQEQQQDDDAGEEQDEDKKTTTQKQKQSSRMKRAKRPEDWTSERDDPLTKPRQSDATLSCPCCFTPLCYDCQRHEVYVNQYRAMFVTDECEARLTDFREYDGDRYHPVFCSTCGTEVGVFEPADELYHFYNTIPGC